MQSERMTDVIAYHLEGPCWWEAWGGLRAVDMLAGDVLTIGAEGTIAQRTHVDKIAACVRPRRGGGAIIVTEHGFVLEEPDGTLRPFAEADPSPELRMNEGGCAPDGSMYAGQMAYAKTKGAARLFHVDQKGHVATVLEGATTSNGIDFSPDGTLAYYNDTPTSQIDVFDWDAQQGLTNRRPFVRLPDLRPDGLTVDAEGGVWVALFNSGRVERYAPDGTKSEVVEVGARKVTACTFGGPGLDRMFITTSRENLPEGEDPAAGSIFTVVPGVLGKPALPFTG